MASGCAAISPAVLGCPYEGEIKPQAVVDVAKVLWDLGCYEISLGDTIGVGTPLKARQLLRAVAGHVPMANLAMHFHDTYGQALANLYAGMEEGCRVIDSAAGGLGGCPYAPGATGNVATEDVVYMLEGMGIATGVDMPKLVAATNEVSRLIGRPPVSRVRGGVECEDAARLTASLRGERRSDPFVRRSKTDCFATLAMTLLYRPPSGPITRSGSPVEIPGKKHSSSTASIISSTNGSVPQITSLSGISGATLRMTKMFRPDRRVDQAHLHHDGHDDAEPDDVEIGGAQRRQDDRRGHQDDRHRRQEEAEHDHHHAGSRPAIPSAADAWRRSASPPIARCADSSSRRNRAATCR